MDNMPHLVEMHKKHAGKGLVIMTVSLDPVDKKDLVEQAKKFLRELNPPFQPPVQNFLLDASDDLKEKLGATFQPCYYVFDRRGKWVRFSALDEGGVNYKQMDKVILQMLEEK